MAQGTAEIYTSTISSPAISTGGTLKRTVDERIRELWPESAPLLAITAKGPTRGGQKVSGKGLVSKQSSNTFKFEWFTFTPIGVAFTVASGSGTAPVLSSATGLTVGMTIVNLNTMETGIIDAISTNTLTVVALGSSWSSAATNRLLSMAPAFKEGSSSPEQQSKDEDNVFNYTQIFRYAVEIAKTAKTNPHYGGDFFQRIKKRSMTQGKRYVENTVLFGKKAASGDTTSTTNRGSVHSTKGLWNYAAKTFNASGAMTATKWRKNLPLAMSDTVNDDDTYIVLCGRHIFGEIQDFYPDKLQIQANATGKYSKLGLKSFTFITAGPTFEVVKHNAFDQVGNQNRALVFRPEDVNLRFKKDADWQVENGMQANDEHTQEDGIWGTVGVQVEDGGNNITKIENWGADGAV